MLPGSGHERRERLELVEELVIGIEVPHELLHTELVRLVRVELARRAFSLAQRLLEIELEARGDDRPRADQRLPDEVLLVRIVHPARDGAPAANLLGPYVV